LGRQQGQPQRHSHCSWTLIDGPGGHKIVFTAPLQLVQAWKKNCLCSSEHTEYLVGHCYMSEQTVAPDRPYNGRRFPKPPCWGEFIERSRNICLETLSSKLLKYKGRANRLKICLAFGLERASACAKHVEHSSIESRNSVRLSVKHNLNRGPAGSTSERKTLP